MSVVKITEGSSNKLLFIDVDEKPLAVVKEEQPSLEEKDSSTKTDNIKCVECAYTSTSAERMTRHIRTTHRGEKPYQCSWCHYGTTNSVMYKEHINMHRDTNTLDASASSINNEDNNDDDNGNNDDDNENNDDDNENNDDDNGNNDDNNEKVKLEMPMFCTSTLALISTKECEDDPLDVSSFVEVVHDETTTINEDVIHKTQVNFKRRRPNYCNDKERSRFSLNNTFASFARERLKCERDKRALIELQKLHMIEEHELKIKQLKLKNEILEIILKKIRGVKPYQCSQCPYRSVSKKYIKLHEQKHGKCSNCGFVANNRPALRRHLRENLCSSTDTDSKTYNCEPCGITYKDAFALRVHKKNHRKCTYCNKTVTKDVYSEHLKKVHGVNNKELKKFRCKLCDFSTIGPQKIMLHLIHHPNQDVDGFDITPLVKAGILVGVE